MINGPFKFFLSFNNNNDDHVEDEVGLNHNGNIILTETMHHIIIIIDLVEWADGMVAATTM
jgi:hypothetical protein